MNTGRSLADRVAGRAPAPSLPVEARVRAEPPLDGASAALDDGGVVAGALLAVVAAVLAGLQLLAGYGGPASLSALAALVFGTGAVLRARRRRARPRPGSSAAGGRHGVAANPPGRVARLARLGGRTGLP